MNIISDTLTAVVERWDDPGDYPSNAGSGPIPSCNYVAAVEGAIVLTLESSDFIEGFEKIEYDLPHGIRIEKWNVKIADGLIVLTVEDFEHGEMDDEC